MKCSDEIPALRFFLRNEAPFMPTPTVPAAATVSPASSPAPSEDASSQSGLLSALFAFVLWGFLPLYWKSIDTVNSFEILCHRIFWSFFVLLPFMFFQ